MTILPAGKAGREGERAMAVVALASAMFLGGGGTPSPLTELALQLLFAAIFGLWLVVAGKVPGVALRPVLGLCGLLLVLPLVQLVPLPPVLWHALPGRSLERAALDLVGAAETWRPWSLAPARTTNAALALVPPAMMLLMTATLDRRGRSALVLVIAGGAFLTILVGAAQAAGGPANPLRFYAPEAAYLSGFQANHNSTADVLLIGMVAFSAVVRDWREVTARKRTGHLPAAILAVGVGLLSLGVFLTASRAGTALLPVAWIAVLALTRPLWPASLPRIAAVAGGCAVAAAVAVFVLRDNAVVGQVLARYDFSGEVRPRLWGDSLAVAQTYFPLGAGMGAFIPVYMAGERLEAVGLALPNRAHNDLLELVIEAGVPGLVVLAAIVAILGRLARERLRDPDPVVRRQAIFALAGFTIVALHSQVDYPLRSISLACMAAALAGLLVPGVRGARGADGPGKI
ncbi:O-antigen ligase family protein [Novosphingobium bradum]|uniref:O-antigen ligase family protein n=1 Tax=Novosphingobium bradum TaxID=1737444 RepID=A0ABV7IS81_9SPHN